MGFHDVAFLPFFLKIVIVVITLGPPHVLKLWLGVSKGMLPVICLCSYKESFCAS